MSRSTKRTTRTTDAGRLSRHEQSVLCYCAHLCRHLSTSSRTLLRSLPIEHMKTIEVNCLLMYATSLLATLINYN